MQHAVVGADVNNIIFVDGFGVDDVAQFARACSEAVDFIISF